MIRTTSVKGGLRSKLISAVMTIFAGTLLSAAAQATPVQDTYIGGVANYGGVDVIGDAAEFDIMSMDAKRVGSHLQVTMNTNFAGESGQYKAYTKNGKGIGYGDLFLANDWTPFGSDSAHRADTAYNGTHWRYGFSLNDSVAKYDRYHNNGGTGFLYALNGKDNDADAYMSDDFLKNAIWRNDQVVAVDRNSRTIKKLGAGTWGVDIKNKTVSFDFDLTGTTLLNDSTLALHWDMMCANDVIEGVVRVPVGVPAPETAPLMAAGAIALVLVRRRRPAKR